MKTKFRTFGVALMSMVASAMLCSQPSFAGPEDEPDPDFEDDIAFYQRPAQARLSDLAGSWAISLGGNTGCGLSTMYVTVTLDASGYGLARIQGSSTGCGPGLNPAEPFQIQSLNADGSGTAGLSCGPGCGWTFTIQVPRDDNDTFTLVDVTDRNNVLVGTAARKW
jgi:hypothetical protein